MTLLAPTTTSATHEVVIPQYSLGRVIGTWAAAAVPMGALAWVGAPLLPRWPSRTPHAATAVPC
jgi:hypothetical protein